MHPTRVYAPTTVSLNTTGADIGSWKADLSFGANEMSLILGIPITIFGLGVVILVKVLWTRNGLSFSLDSRPTGKKSRCPHFTCCPCEKKLKSSPSTSMDSVSSDVLFNQMAQGRRALGSRNRQRDRQEGILLTNLLLLLLLFLTMFVLFSICHA